MTKYSTCSQHQQPAEVEPEEAPQQGHRVHDQQRQRQEERPPRAGGGADRRVNHAPATPPAADTDKLSTYR